ncbi:MAG: M48 family metallopeptidase [Candidatus Acidiferrales bacterium]
MIGFSTRKFLYGLALLLLFAGAAMLAAPSGVAGSNAGATLPNAARETQTPASSGTMQADKTRTEVKAYTLPPDLYEKAVKYSRAQYILYFADFVWGVIVLLLVLAWRLAPKYRDWAERATKSRFLQAVIFTPILLLTIAVLGLPTGIYGHWLSRSYGISVQGWGSWAWDWSKGEIVSFIIGIILVWVLYAVIRRSPRRWWFYFWLAALPILFFVIFLAPLVIAPLFNKFEPLETKDPALVVALEKVVQRAGMNIPAQRMFWMNESDKGNDLNAYVAGFGASKRVVVWDTTIAKMDVPETMFVFGHEMGHYVLGHVYKGLIFGAVLLLVLLYLGFRGMLWALARCSGRWGIRGTDDWASLPVLLLWFAILGFLASPATNTFSRHVEHQADQYGLEVTHGLIPDSSQVAARAFQILGEVDLSDPHPNSFIELWLYNHPPLAERVNYALTYDPWGKGQAPEFVKGQ